MVRRPMSREKTPYRVQRHLVRVEGRSVEWRISSAKDCDSFLLLLLLLLHHSRPVSHRPPDRPSVRPSAGPQLAVRKLVDPSTFAYRGHILFSSSYEERRGHAHYVTCHSDDY